MKKLLLFSLFISVNLLTAQTNPWLTQGSNITSINSGFVGIGQGTLPAGATAQDKLIVNGHVFAPQFNSSTGVFTATGANNINFRTGTVTRLTIVNTTGFVGINKSTPAYTLDVAGTINASNFLLNGSPLTSGGSALWILNGSNTNIHYGNNASGNVGIGTANPDFRLTVNGKIKCEEVQVVVDVPADYVFQQGYNLMPLPELEKYIQSNHHLPNIPNAEALVANGWSIGAMNNKLLEKIEELTLYLIEIKKENDLLKERIEKLEMR